MADARRAAGNGWLAVAALSAAMVLLAVVPQIASPTRPDIAWLLYAAGRLLEGGRLYVDVVEPNPPLIVWLNLPPAWLAGALGLPPAAVYHVMVALLGVGSVLVCLSLLRRCLPGEVRLQQYLVLALVLVLFPLVRTNFGQREHLCLLLILPLALLALLRMQGGPIAPGCAAALGAAAAGGIALKPYFVLPWLALEACVRLGGGRGRRLRLLPETAAVILGGLLYLALVPLLAPEYLTLAPLMAGAYYDYFRNPLAVAALAGEGAGAAAAAILIALLLRARAVHRDLWIVLGALAAGYYLEAVAQHKGWEYHFYPAVGVGTLLFVLATADVRGPATGLAHRLAGAAARAAVVTLAAAAIVGSLAQVLRPGARLWQPDASYRELLPVATARAAAGPVTVLSWSVVSSFPLLSDAGARSGSRFNCLWMLASLYGAAAERPEPLRYRERAEMGGLERYVNDAVVEDLTTRRPALLLVLVPAPDEPRWLLRRIDLLAYFQRDERFAAAFSRYRHLGTAGQYWAFERLPDSAPPVPARARPAHWNLDSVAATWAAESAREVDWPALARIVLFGLVFGLAWLRESRAAAARQLRTPEAA